MASAHSTRGLYVLSGCLVGVIAALPGCYDGARGSSPMSMGAGPSEEGSTAMPSSTDGGETGQTSGNGTTPGGPTTDTPTSQGGEVTGDETASADESDGDDGTDTGEPIPEPTAMCAGYATRYWDCCKPHCSWEGNVNPAVDTLGTCNEANVPQASADVPSSCSRPGPESAHTCYSLAPWAVGSDLAYGFAAIPGAGDICGRCYRLDFTGVSHNAGDDPGSAALGGKTMIVQAVNIGYDVGGGQFDLLIPGGGVGAFDACSAQWGVDSGQLGATYGGFLTTCKQQVGNDHEALKDCVLDRCSMIFDGPGYGELQDACSWFVDWFEVADNPALEWGEVQCPAAIVGASGMDRAVLDDVVSCDGSKGGGDCGGGCDCSWTEGGAACGDDDGSCCWGVCCG